MDPKATLLLFLTGDEEEMKQAAFDYNRWVSQGGFKARVIYKDRERSVAHLDLRPTIYLSWFDGVQFPVHPDEVRIVK